MTHARHHRRGRHRRPRGGAHAARARHRLRLFEQGSEIRELGVGINTLPHAIKELAEIGLLERLDHVGIRTHELTYANRFGQEIWREPRGTDAGFPYPQFSIHRGRLQKRLHQALRARLGDSHIHTGCRLGSWRQDESGVTAYFFNRDGSQRNRARRRAGRRRRHSFGGARTLAPHEGPPRLERHHAVARRARLAAIPRRSLDDRRRRDGGEARALPDRAKATRHDTRLTNWAVAAKDRRRRRAAAQGGLVAARPARGAVAACAQIRAFPASMSAHLIEATSEFYEYPMCDRDPLPRWSQGRVTLLGDAAHPMYPVGSNGASQAMLDARALADWLVRADHPAASAPRL